jgi:hypothetical protein
VARVLRVHPLALLDLYFDDGAGRARAGGAGGCGCGRHAATLPSTPPRDEGTP